MKVLLKLLGCLAIGFMACTSVSDKTDTKTLEFTPIAFETKLLEKKGGPCKDDNDACATVTVSYPLASKGLPHVTQAINDTLQQLLISMIAGGMVEDGAKIKSMEAAAQSYIESYQLELKENPDMMNSWSNEISSAITFLSAELAAIQMDNFSYSGGAHPNAFATYLVFDLETGKTLHLKDLVIDTTAVQPLVEKAFKEARELPITADLTAAGFFWDGAFSFPANIGVNKDGIMFFYNPYEVASYAEGPTGFVLPYETLKGMLNPAYFPSVSKK